MRKRDLTGQRFGKLVVLEATSARDKKGYVMWHCRCDCGNELAVSGNCLCYTPMKSCGCQKKEHSQQLGSYLQHVDGTSLDMLKSRKVPSNNTTGVKGVYFIRGKYVAKIVFQKKQYILGRFDTLEEAAAVRRETEVQLNDRVVAHYERWNARAAIDPQWAEENPVHVRVEKDAAGELNVICLPEWE